LDGKRPASVLVFACVETVPQSALSKIVCLGCERAVSQSLLREEGRARSSKVKTLKHIIAAWRNACASITGCHLRDPRGRDELPAAPHTCQVAGIYAHRRQHRAKIGCNLQNATAFRTMLCCLLKRRQTPALNSGAGHQPADFDSAPSTTRRLLKPAALGGCIDRSGNQRHVIIA